MDEQLQNKQTLITNQDYFNNEVMLSVVKYFVDNNKLITEDFNTIQNINNLIVNEYYNQYRGLRQ